MRGYMQQGLLVRARNEARRCLQADPGDVEAMKSLAEISASLNEPEQATPYFKSLIDSCMKKGDPDGTQLTWETVNWYIDTLLEAKQYRDALQGLTTVSRWLLGRADETYWDELDDDREWDIDDEPRRVAIPAFQKNRVTSERYGEGLPIELRVKLGLIRVSLGKQYLDEAVHHFHYLEADDQSAVADYADLFHEAGDALRLAGHYEEALRFYKPLEDVDSEVVDVGVYFDIAITYHALGRKREMQECLNRVQQTANGRDANYQLGLAKMYQALGREDLMWTLVSVLKRAGKRDIVRKAGLPLRKPVTVPTAMGDAQEDEDDEDDEDDRDAGCRSEDEASPPPPDLSANIYETIEQEDETLPGKQMKPKASGGTRQYRKYKTSEQEEQLKDDVAEAMYAELLSLSAAVEAEEPEAMQQWLQLCSELFEDFRHQPAFFNPEKYLPFTGFKRARQLRIPHNSNLLDNPKVEFEVPTDYRTIDFDDWVDLLMAYALRSAKNGDSSQCWTVIEVAEEANIVAQDEERIRLVKVAGITCALVLGEEKRLCERTRWFIKTYPYQSDVYRLHSVLHRACRGPLLWYNAGPEQKFLMRQVKAMDFALLPEARQKEMLAGGQIEGITGKAEHNPHNITEHDPVLLALYGHLMLAAGSFGNALAYYFRAYAIVPDDPVVCLYIAVSYIGIAFKRQTVERQYMIQQGMAFATKYYQIRSKGGSAILRQEADFNIALLWHKMGLMHLAIEGYEKVIVLSDKVQREGTNRLKEGGVVEDFAADAAHALQTILGLVGAVQRARSLTEEWLVLD